MSKNRNIADLLDANGDVKSANLDNVPPSNDASALTTGTLPIARISDGSVTEAKIADAAITSLKSGRKNLIINGAMQVAQRGTSSTTAGYRTLDRYSFNQTGMDNFTFSITQNTSSGLSEFPCSLKFTTTTAENAVDANDRAYFDYRIEGQNLQHLGYGTSDAKTMTLSFWVKSSVTGTYASFIYQDDATRSYLANWTIDNANTWEKKTITIDGDTSGNINNDNGPALYLRWFLFAGSDWSGTGTPLNTWGSTSGRKEAPNHNAQVPLTNNSTWELTGVQAEIGDTATDFEHRSYGEELALCQRYYWQHTYGYLGLGWASGSQWLYQENTFPTTMRATPSLSYTGGTGGTWSTNTVNNDITVRENMGWCIYTKTSYSGTDIYVTGGITIKADAEL